MSNLEKQGIRKRRPPIQLYVPPAQRKHAGSKSDSTSAEKLRSDMKIGPSNVLKDTKLSVQSQMFEVDDMLQLLVNGIFLDWNYAVTDRSLPLFYPECKTVKYQTFKYFFPFDTVQIFCKKRFKYTLYMLSLKDYQIFKWYNTPQIMETSVNNNINMYQILRQSIFIFNNADIETCMFASSSSFTIFNLYEYRTSKCKLLEDNLCMCTKAEISQGSDFYPDFYVEQYLALRLDKHICGVNVWKHLDDIDNHGWNVLKIILENQIKSNSKPEAINNMKISKSTHQENAIDDNALDILESSAESEISSGAITEIKKYAKIEQDQEAQIMKKTKQNINRKTRHIIKYIDNENDVLMIENSNVSHWEDLFDNEHLQVNLFPKDNHKQTSSTKTEKFEDDFSNRLSKSNEELEHVVELYGFPSSFATHDIISAFHEVHNDSMYVKWINDTQALLILGSSSQAQKALSLSHPLIKVRSMSEASKSAIEKANQSDIKPAMKRPETNLNTARRLITSHLGAKSRISKEQTAKEKESLRKAKETRRMLKQNEKDAWEGNLRSALN
ncbi:uncharacterized protein LOC132696571 [Cylas formicarius]|uniref:uncharacterized protein LOC132696571 n=1 Tax=Cylas formicarius TaxID=197179 RepID=UPI002958DB59|nr:uncharacterized protein LOC132696571 [Cylas formicarius]